MKINRLIPGFVCCIALIGACFSASGDQFLTNGDFESLPLAAQSATNTFPGWLEGSNGSTVTTNAVAISGSYSALIQKFSGGDLHQNLVTTTAWQSDWVFEGDFACSSPGGSAARSLQLNLYHTTTANISLRVIDAEPDGTGDVQLYNGTAFVTILSNAVTFSATPTNLNVNHIKIVGHYYTNVPNYDLFITSASYQVFSATNQTLWQAGAPSTNGTSRLVQVRFDTANLVAGAFEVVDNLSLTVANLAPTMVAITTQPSPASAAIYQGYTGTYSISTTLSGTPPFFYQWQFNGVNIPNATNNPLVLSNLTSAAAGNYSVIVSNVVGNVSSSNAVISFISTYNTAQMTNIWNLSPGDQPFLTTGNNERGLAFNAVTTNLLICSHFAAPTNNIAVLNPANGAFKYFMNMTGVAADVSGSTLGVNMIGVADDGVVYGGSVTQNAGSASTPYNLYQWTSDDSNSAPTDIFVGDPGYSTTASGLRWGDNIAVRGAGVGTQILIAPGSGTNVALFTTSDGVNFLPTIISVSNVVSAFAKNGLTFGPGTNTFWAKNGGSNLYLVQFDLTSGTGFATQIFASNTVSSALRGIAASTNGRWLVGTASGIPDNVQLYDVSNLANGPVYADQELYATDFANNNIAGGVGSAAFNGNYVYVLDQNNGIKAFLIDPSFIAAPPIYTITSVVSQPGIGTILTWQSTAGKIYQVQSKTNLSSGAWTNVGSSITATGSSTSLTNAVSGTTQFFRIQRQ